MDERYVGKPFLRILECYILFLIGQLDDAQKQVLHKMEPKLVELYKQNGRWYEIVEKQMNFSPEINKKIQAVWLKSIDMAYERGDSVDPNDFAIQFVAQNFPDILKSA